MTRHVALVGHAGDAWWATVAPEQRGDEPGVWTTVGDDFSQVTRRLREAGWHRAPGEIGRTDIGAVWPAYYVDPTLKGPA